MFSLAKPSASPAKRDSAVMHIPVLSRVGSMFHSCFACSGTGIFLFLIIAMSVLVLPASADLPQVSSSITGNVYVSSVKFDPAVFFTGDVGTATFTVVNGNANESIMVNHVAYLDDNIRLTSNTYDHSNSLGPLQSRDFTFTVATSSFAGYYYPTFSANLYDLNLYHTVMVQVDNTPLILTILNKPDTFTQGKKDTVTVQIANPRKNDVKNVVLEVSGSGIAASPSKIYIGSLVSGAETNETLSVTPVQESPVTFTVNYDNGDNPHTISLDLPVSFTEDKKQAMPQMSNIQVNLVNGIYHVTGDVTNAGLETANGVTVTSLSPVVAQDPYKSYVIGALKPDDFGSFEVTFLANGTVSVPLQMSYKDADGNIISSQQDVAIPAAVSSQKQDQPYLLPVIGFVLFLAVAGGYLYMKRRKTQ